MSKIAEFFNAVSKNDVEQVKSILAEQPDLLNFVREEDYFQDSPLVYAAKHDAKDVLEYLLAQKADINKINVYAFNPYFAAVNEHNLDLALFILNQDGIDLKHKTYSKADYLGQIFKVIQHYGVLGYNEKINDESISKLIDAVIEKGFNVNTRQLSSMDNSVTLAANSQSWPLVAYLINKGGDYTANNMWGHDIWTAFCGNQYLSREHKNQIFEILDNCVKSSGSKYGELKKPEHLYVGLDGVPFNKE